MSVVAIGADGGTAVSVAAKGRVNVEFENYVASNGFDPATMNDQQRTFIRARFEQEHPPTPTVTAADRELQRVEAIHSACDEFVTKYTGTGSSESGFTDTVERIKAAAEKALAAGWDRQRRIGNNPRSRPQPVNAFHRGPPQASVPDLLTAALMTKAGFESQAEKLLGAPIMERPQIARHVADGVVPGIAAVGPPRRSRQSRRDDPARAFRRARCRSR